MELNQITTMNKNIKYMSIINRVLKSLESDNPKISIPLNLFLNIGGIILIWTTLVRMPILFEIFLLLLFSWITYNIRKLRKKSFIVFLIFSLFVFASVSFLNFNQNLRNDFRIMSIMVSEEESLWENITSGSNENIGFKEISSEVWNKWKVHTTINDSTSNHFKTVAYVKQILNSILIHKYELKNDPNNLPLIAKGSECNFCYSYIVDSSYYAFSEKITDSFIRGGNFLNCISYIFPAENELGNIHVDLMRALKYFKRDLLRERVPIFDLVVQNNIDREIVLNKISLEMRNLQVDMKPKSHGGNTLKSEKTYNWQLINLKDTIYRNWFNDQLKLHPSGFEADYNEELQKSFLILDPPIKIPPRENVRFKIRIIDGYRWSSEIRFRLYSLNKFNRKTKWYKFIPTSHPVINIYN